jgi:gamma-carbonic anhydrase
VLRADKHAIKVGSFSNIQDHAVVQCVNDSEPAFPPNTSIGSHVTVGHGARLTSCLVADQALIGQGSVISEGCVVGTGSIIAAGAVLPPNTHVPAMQLWAGNPAKFIRAVTDAELAASITGALEYSKLGAEQGAEFGAFDAKYNK